MLRGGEVLRITGFYISDEYERDVQVFSKKFNLNRMAFRVIMKSPIVHIPVHKLSYEATAKELYDALEDGYRFSISDQNRTDEINFVSRNAIVNCRNRLLRFSEEGDNGKAAEDFG